MGIGGCPHAGIEYWKTEPGSRDIQHQCPHSHSSNCLWSRSLDGHERSLDRHERSPSWHRPERHVTFCNPEVELILSERSYRGPWGHSTGAQLERGNGGPCPSDGQKWYVPRRCPWPTWTLEIEWVIFWNHQLRTMKCGWIGEPTS